MIRGAHVIVYSEDAEADRAFFRDVLGFPHVDIGSGWLLFALPPAEVAVHPTHGDMPHELYLICDDVAVFRDDMVARGVRVSDVQEEGWGALVSVTLPGGGQIGVYEARHPLAHEVGRSSGG